MKTLRKTDLESMERELKVLENSDQMKVIGGYTYAQYESMLDNDTWKGGDVDGWGYIGPTAGSAPGTTASQIQQVISYGEFSYSISESVRDYTSGRTTKEQFSNNVAKNIISLAPGGNGITHGIDIFCAYISEATRRFENFINGGWMNSQYGWF